jgi:integrase
LCALPASVTTIDVYISHLVQREISTSVVYSVYYGIKWEHDLNLFTSIFSEQFIKMILEGSVRILSKPVKKKEPITSDILKTILRKQYPIDNLQKLRICCLLLLGYAGFLRFNELAQIRASNLKFSHLEILIERSKTDIYRQGHTVVIARTNNDTCPVAMYEKYLLKADIALDSDDFIFRYYHFSSPKIHIVYAKLISLYLILELENCYLRL